MGRKLVGHGVWEFDMCYLYGEDSFANLYDFEKRIKRLYKLRVKNTGEMNKKKMVETGYEVPHIDRYFCYFFDDEITLAQFNNLNYLTGN